MTRRPPLLLHSFGIIATLIVAGLCATAGYMTGLRNGRESERQWWQEKMVERGQMHYHDKSGKLHWTNKSGE